MNESRKNQLFADINELAHKACSLMNRSQRSQYFKFQEQRLAEGVSVKKKYKVPVRRYYKGAKKGQLRELYNVNGPIFEQLWKKLYSYALIATKHSHFTNNESDPVVMDDISEIKYQSLWNLRNFGPVYNEQGFDERFRLIVSNVLTNSANKRRKSKTILASQAELFQDYLIKGSRGVTLQVKILSIAKQVIALPTNCCDEITLPKNTQLIPVDSWNRQSTTSLFSTVGGSDDDEMYLIDTVADNLTTFDMLDSSLTDIPEAFRKPIEYLFNEHSELEVEKRKSLDEICNMFDLTKKQLRTHLASVL